MTVFLLQAKDSKLSTGSDYNRGRLADFLKKNDGIRLRLEPETPESRKQRGYFEGGLVKLATYFQDSLEVMVKGKKSLKRIDYHESDDCRIMREILKEEAGLVDYVIIKNNLRRIVKSSAGGRNLKIVTNFTFDWLKDQGCPDEAMKPEKYKYWKDAIYPSGGPDNWIDYCISVNILKPK